MTAAHTCDLTSITCGASRQVPK
uniref:Uncharacterized protein n=1 Tax=Rhizophora mucronata TaxID=61149 RepID=A0A2P2PU77_RHIMU